MYTLTYIPLLCSLRKPMSIDNPGAIYATTTTSAQMWVKGIGVSKSNG